MWRKVDLKRYELKDHLGNVRVIVSDLRHCKLTAGVPTDFSAIIKHYSNYYPFGMEKPGMVWDKGSYRYGYQGQEVDNEMIGTSNAISYKYRVEDARLGRFFSIDPLSAKYPWNSPYAFSENRVIDGVELEGLEVYLIYQKSTSTIYAIDQGKYEKNLPVKQVTPDTYCSYKTSKELGYNQLLVISNTKTGGHQDTKDNTWKSKNTPMEEPIPNGEYAIVDNKRSTRPSQYTGTADKYFRLDPIDSKPFNDTDDDNPNLNYLGEKRDGYRLHPGFVSHGCVTMIAGEGWQKKWNALSGMILTTSAKVVTDQSGINPFKTRSLIHYGKMIVQD